MPRKKTPSTSPSNQRNFSKQTRSGYELDRVSAHIHRKRAKRSKQRAPPWGGGRRGLTCCRLRQPPSPRDSFLASRRVRQRSADCRRRLQQRKHLLGQEGERSRPAPSRTRVTARPLRAHIEGSDRIFLFVCLREREASGELLRESGRPGVRETNEWQSSVDALLTKERMAPVCLLFNGSGSAPWRTRRPFPWACVAGARSMPPPPSAVPLGSTAKLVASRREHPIMNYCSSNRWVIWKNVKRNGKKARGDHESGTTRDGEHGPRLRVCKTEEAHLLFPD
jgi:hypothetical protein